MRQIIKMAKNGQEITFVCSVCGNLIYDMFVPVGKKYEPDWNKIQEICECGTRLVRRNPIIDDSDIDIYRVNNNKNNENQKKNIYRNRSERSDIYTERIKDLEGAISIDYFDMRLENIKGDNFKIPNNIDNLMIECIKRNISHVELSIEHVNDTYVKKELQEKLNNLKLRYSDLSKKLEDKKDLDDNERMKDANRNRDNT